MLESWSMKKLLAIVVLGFLWCGSAQSFFSDPIEKCMDKVQAKGVYISYAAKICNNFTKDSTQCMNDLLYKGIYVTASAKYCNGGKNGSYKCMKKLVNSGICYRCCKKMLWNFIKNYE